MLFQLDGVHSVPTPNNSALQDDVVSTATPHLNKYKIMANSGIASHALPDVLSSSSIGDPGTVSSESDPLTRRFKKGHRKYPFGSSSSIANEIMEPETVSDQASFESRTNPKRMKSSLITSVFDAESSLPPNIEVSSNSDIRNVLPIIKEHSSSPSKHNGDHLSNNLIGLYTVRGDLNLNLKGCSGGDGGQGSDDDELLQRCADALAAASSSKKEKPRSSSKDSKKNTSVKEQKSDKVKSPFFTDKEQETDNDEDDVPTPQQSEKPPKLARSFSMPIYPSNMDLKSLWKEMDGKAAPLDNSAPVRRASATRAPSASILKTGSSFGPVYVGDDEQPPMESARRHVEFSDRQVQYTSDTNNPSRSLVSVVPVKPEALMRPPRQPSRKDSGGFENRMASNSRLRSMSHDGMVRKRSGSGYVSSSADSSGGRVCTDFTRPFDKADMSTWSAEQMENIRLAVLSLKRECNYGEFEMYLSETSRRRAEFCPSYLSQLSKSAFFLRSNQLPLSFVGLDLDLIRLLKTPLVNSFEPKQATDDKQSSRIGSDRFDIDKVLNITVYGFKKSQAARLQEYVKEAIMTASRALKDKQAAADTVNVDKLTAFNTIISKPLSIVKYGSGKQWKLEGTFRSQANVVFLNDSIRFRYFMSRKSRVFYIFGLLYNLALSSNEPDAEQADFQTYKSTNGRLFSHAYGKYYKGRRGPWPF